MTSNGTGFDTQTCMVCLTNIMAALQYCTSHTVFILVVHAHVLVVSHACVIHVTSHVVIHWYTTTYMYLT